MKALRSINKPHVKWIEKAPDVKWIQPIKSRKGNNLLVKSGGEINPVYDMDDPGKLANAYVKDLKKMKKLYKESISILVGMGLGYLTESLLKSMEKGHRLLVIEPVAHMIRLAFHQFDFSKYIADGRLMMVPADNDTIIGALQTLSGARVISDWHLTINKYTQFRREEYANIITLTSEVLNQILCNTGTVAGDAGAIIADNDIACLPYVIRHRGVAELTNIFKGKPAILVSTGPSLAKNIHHLIDLKDRVIIVAVGQALRVLLAYDIRPDFICTVDFGDINMGHFEGLMDSDVPLITINRAYAPLLKAWQGPKFIAATPVPGFEHMATGILTDKGHIEAGGSVAHLCLGVAQLLGCNPITFVGQDLSLGATSHIAQADAMGEILVGENGQILWKVNDQRCRLHSDEMVTMGYAHNIPGYYGGEVTTNMGLASFLTVFESMVERHQSIKGNLIINATEGGARIKGTKLMSLKQVIKKYCQDPIDKNHLKSLLTMAEEGDELISKVIPLLQDDIDRLDVIIKNCRIAKAVNHGMKTLMSRSKYKKLLPKKRERLFDRCLAEAREDSSANTTALNYSFYDKLLKALPKKSPVRHIIVLSVKNFHHSEIAHQQSIQNPLVNVAIYGASRAIYDRDLKADQTIKAFLKDFETAMIRMNRNNLILNAAQEASESLHKSYNKTLDLLKEYDETKNNDLLVIGDDYKVDLDDAEDYFEKGNWAHPLLDAQKKMHHSNYDALDQDVRMVIRDIHIKALEMRNTDIEKAKESEDKHHDEMVKLIKCNDLIERSRELGLKEKDFKGALALLRKAVKLIPDNMEACWGLASALHHSRYLDESVSVYKKLVADYPDNLRFKFEMAQVMLINKTMDVQDGLKIVGEVMAITDEFDHFLSKIGDIYMQSNLPDEACITYQGYLDKYPADFDAWLRYGLALKAAGKPRQADLARKKAREIKPDHEPSQVALKNITHSDC